MLESVTNSLAGIVKRVRGQARINEHNIAEAVDQIRDTLIDADVAVQAAEAFIERTRQRALGKEVQENLSPAEAFVGVVHEELAALLGSEQVPISVPLTPPCPLLLVGLQGTGKTTTAAKIAVHLRALKRRLVVVSADVRRPAAIEQLGQLCAQEKIDFFDPDEDAQDPIKRSQAAIKYAQAKLLDYVIIDSAGRSSADADLMDELENLSRAVIPAETLLVLDATQGQEALTTARDFEQRLALTGLIISKLDGDARGGAAISGRTVLGVPIKLIGTGEKTADIEPFHPQRMASRILGLGDILSIVEKASESMNARKMAELDRKLKRKKGAGMSLEDMITQLSQAEESGTFSDLASKLPANTAAAVEGFGKSPEVLRSMKAVFNSMTHLERRAPHILKASRKRRIAAGAGVDVQDVNNLISRHNQANKLMKRVAKNPKAMMQMLRGMGG